MPNRSFKQIEVKFHNQNDALAGTLSFPNTLGLHPAIVMLHGSGPVDRNNENYFPSICDYFVSQGFAVLCYDKPGIGGSTGDWKQQSFADRANEALAAIEYLKQIREINTEQIGLWGHSQGGWIVFLAASKSKSISFIISNSGPGIPTFEQDRYGIEYLNRAAGESEENIIQALKLYDSVMEAARVDQSFKQVMAMISVRQNEAWNRYFNMDPGLWVFFKKNYKYDPLPALQGTTCPVLSIFGEKDFLVPVQRSIAVFKKVFTKEQSRDFTVITFPGADHRIRASTPPILAPGYLEVMGKWLRQHVKTS